MSERFSFIRVCCAGWKQRWHNTSCQAIYRLNGFEKQCLWNCSISIQRTAITQSNMAVDRIALQWRCIYYNVNPPTLCFISYASVLHLGDPPWGLLAVPTHPLLLPVLSSHLKTQPEAICLLFLEQPDAYSVTDIQYVIECTWRLSAFCVCPDYPGNTTSSQVVIKAVHPPLRCPL